MITGISKVVVPVDDQERAKGELRERGVAFSVSPQRQPFGWW